MGFQKALRFGYCNVCSRVLTMTNSALSFTPWTGRCFRSTLLQCLKRRLLLQYYHNRQVESLKFDIQLLYIHCTIYNRDEAAIVFVASELMNLLLSTVADAEIEFSTEISAKMT